MFLFHLKSKFLASLFRSDYQSDISKHFSNNFPLNTRDYFYFFLTSKCASQTLYI